MIYQTGGNPAGLSNRNAREALVRRAAVLGRIRKYFSEQGVLEVETPLLREYGVTDPQLENIRAEKPFSDCEWLYLQTSPEYAMKQLLAMDSGSIYQICKAFRQDPVGRLHNIEFTMLEWYRIDYSLEELVDDVASVVEEAGIHREKEVVTYQQLFMQYLGIDPLAIDLEEITEIARQKIDIDAESDDRDFWLDLLLTHCIEPNLGKNRFTFVTGYPESQAALAQLKKDRSGNNVAERFELYIDGMEIANAYSELIDAQVYRQRFAEDNRKRKKLELPVVETDKEFLQSIETGLPACSGVAMGVDRLLLVASGALQDLD